MTTTQRTPEWFTARLGLLTASCASAMLATVKVGEAAARRDLRTQLVLERLTGQPQEDGFVSKDMQRGADLEADAFTAYEALTGNLAMPCGFLAHDTLMAGCSPDGLVDGSKGGLELKVPKSATHLGYLRAGTMPSAYVAQVTHSLWITGAEWWDFLSFDPRFPASLQTFYVRVQRQDVGLSAYEAAVKTFLAEVDKEYNELAAMAEKAAA